ncbi:lytic transglycosylase domain-containing protein [Pelagibius marinus]|uniref:lytic transglycosylase domain-containing protein n=1 Tax=Pelagibius marinus TaxID=2762760 RepID=UPI001872884C|nr:lytic transglycosylase domain-containing protein [Pelagibius marinus]
MILHIGKSVLAVSLAFVSLLAAAAAPLPASAAAGEKLTASDRQLYASALTLFENGQYDRALALARQGKHSLAAKIVTWRDLGRRDSGRSFAEISAFLEANPGWPGLYGLYRNAEEVLPDTLSAAQVLAWFGERLPITGHGALRHAGALWDNGQRDRARTAARHYWVTIDFDSQEEDAFRKRFRAVLTKEDEIDRLDRLLWDHRTTAARRQVQRVPPGPAALARARLALIGNRPGVDALIGRVPSHLSNDPGLTYERAVWRQRRGRLEGVVELLDSLPAGMPEGPAWWRLRNWVVWRALDRNDFDLAYRISARHGHDEGVAFAEGEWLGGWLALRYLKKPTVAYDHFVRLHDGVSSDISKSRGAFWAGEAASELRRTQDARQWYEKAAAYSATFYGQLASQRMGVERQPVLQAMPAMPAPRRALFETNELVAAIRLLGELDQPRLQNLFFARLRQDAEDDFDHRLIIELANSVERQDLAIRTAKTARRNGHDLHLMLYPRRALPVGPAPEAALVLAVMRQESEFYPKARSPVGALGLMQLMPATARHTARGLGIPFNRDRLTSDPDYNLRLGQAYLKELLEQFDGSYILALAAYNAGPSRAERWIKEYGDPRDPKVDAVNWIERIPFSETRNYVQRILESLVVYREGQPKHLQRWALQIPPAGS